MTERVPELLRLVHGQDGELRVAHAVPEHQNLLRPDVVDPVELPDGLDEGRLEGVNELLVAGLEGWKVSRWDEASAELVTLSRNFCIATWRWAGVILVNCATSFITLKSAFICSVSPVMLHSSGTSAISLLTSASSTVFRLDLLISSGCFVSLIVMP